MGLDIHGHQTLRGPKKGGKTSNEICCCMKEKHDSIVVSRAAHNVPSDMSAYLAHLSVNDSTYN